MIARWAPLVLILSACGSPPPPAAPDDVAIAPSNPEPIASADPWAVPVEGYPLWFKASFDGFRALGVSPENLPEGALPPLDNLKLRGCSFDFLTDTRRLTMLLANDKTFLMVLTLRDEAGALDCESVHDGVRWEREGNLVYWGHDDHMLAAKEAVSSSDGAPNDGALLRMGADHPLGALEMSLVGTGSPLVLKTRVLPRAPITPAQSRKRLDHSLEKLQQQLATFPDLAPWVDALRTAQVETSDAALRFRVEIPVTDGIVAFLRSDGFVELMDGRIKQCNRLIEVINREQEPLKQASGSDPAALEKLADTLDLVALRVSAVRLRDERLIGYRDAYATMARDLSGASRDTAAALLGNDPQKAAEAARDMSSFGSRESELVGAINDYCQGE